MTTTDLSINNYTTTATRGKAQQERPRKLRARRQQASPHTTRPGRIVQQPMACVCSAVCKGYVGLVSHRRSCTVFKLLLKGPIVTNVNTGTNTNTGCADEATIDKTVNNIVASDAIDSVDTAKMATATVDVTTIDTGAVDTTTIDASIESTHTTRIDSSDLNTANPSAKLNTTSKHKSADTTIINKLMT